MSSRFFSLWTPVVVWCGLIFFFSHIPDLSTGLGGWDFLLRKAAHIAEFAILAGLFWRAYAGSSSAGISRTGVMTALFSILYAISDEWHQGFVPGRTPALMDVIIDSIGVIGMCWLQYRWRSDFIAYLRGRFNV